MRSFGTFLTFAAGIYLGRQLFIGDSTSDEAQYIDQSSEVESESSASFEEFGEAEVDADQDIAGKFAAVVIGGKHRDTSARGSSGVLSRVGSSRGRSSVAGIRRGLHIRRGTGLSG